MSKSTLEETGELAKKIFNSGLDSVKSVLKKGQEIGKETLNEILESAEIEGKEIKGAVDEIKESLSETLDEGTKEAIIFTFKKLPISGKIKLIESLSDNFRNIEKLKELSPETEIAVNYCLDQCVDKSKLGLPKAKTISELQEVLTKLEIPLTGTNNYPPEAPIVGIKNTRKRIDYVTFYLVKGDYTLKPLNITIPADKLYS